MGNKTLYVATPNTIPTASDKFTFANAEDSNQLQSGRLVDVKAGLGVEVMLEAIAAATDETIADGHTGLVVPLSLNGYNLSAALASVAVRGVTGTTTVVVRRVRTESAIGDSTTQFDISDEGGNTFRYTYDDTGTDPAIADSAASLQIGDIVYINGIPCKSYEADGVFVASENGPELYVSSNSPDGEFTAVPGFESSSFVDKVQFLQPGNILPLPEVTQRESKNDCGEAQTDPGYCHLHIMEGINHEIHVF